MVLDADAKKEKKEERAKNKDEKKGDDNKLNSPDQSEKDATVKPDAKKDVPAVWLCLVILTMLYSLDNKVTFYHS